MREDQRVRRLCPRCCQELPPRSPEDVLEEMQRHHKTRGDGFAFHELSNWLVKHGELQVELAEALVAQSRR